MKIFVFLPISQVANTEKFGPRRKERLIEKTSESKKAFQKSLRQENMNNTTYEAPIVVGCETKSVGKVTRKSNFKYSLYVGQIYHCKVVRTNGQKEFLTYDAHSFVGKYQYDIPQEKPSWILPFYENGEFSFNEKIYSFHLRDIPSAKKAKIVVAKDGNPIAYLIFSKIVAINKL